MTSFGQEPGRSSFYKEQIEECLKLNDCYNAQIMYEGYKAERGGIGDRKIEDSIKACFYKQQTEDYLANNDCGKAQETYNEYRKCGGVANRNIETRIRACGVTSISKHNSNTPKVFFGIGNGIVAGKGMGLYGTMRFGETFSDRNTSSFGVTGGFGLAGSKNDLYRYPWSNDIHEKLYHWSIGLMGLYNIKDKSSLFLSGHYGTVSVLDTQFSGNNNGSFSFQDDRILKGVSVLGGLELTLGNWKRDWFHFTAGIGGTYTLEDNPRIMPAWNVGIGIILNGKK